MLEKYTDEQLLSHLTGLGQWAQIRAKELQYFTEKLPEQYAAANGDPQKLASLQYAFATYVDGVQDLVNRCREAQAEFDRRVSVKA